MDTKIKVEKLAKEIIKENEKEVSDLCLALSITIEEIIQSWIVWDTGINEYDNSIYSSNAMRCAIHLHNYIQGNWHDKRQLKVLDLINKIKPEKIVDVGFGTPQKYVTEYVLKNKIQLSLLDFDKESLHFAESFLNTKSNDWQKYITLKIYDMNGVDAIGDFDIYLFQDSIEHSNKPTEYFQSVVKVAKVNSYFILCIPIEIDKGVPEHNFFWTSKENAVDWVKEAGLKVISTDEIEMDKDLDLFAKFLHKGFLELLVLAQK